MGHRHLGTFSLATIVAFSMSTGISAATPMPITGDLESLGTGQSSAPVSANLIAEVHWAERDDSGSFLSVTWSIENIGNGQEGLAWLRDGAYLYDGQGFSGVSTVDPGEGTRYHPVMDGTGSCLCSGERNNEFIAALNPGEQVAYWSLFSVPADLDSVTVEIPNFDPIEDVPIS
ncbi:hypothetical protein AB0I72_20470 [Nocardiopsis sp. NPDC049922]|uniref:hypothetical protein n=1 Tax=Nocardiopsis sp. NPDC049922 TaxID=3155157 RepID=UPI0033DEAABA